MEKIVAKTLLTIATILVSLVSSGQEIEENDILALIANLNAEIKAGDSTAEAFCKLGDLNYEAHVQIWEVNAEQGDTPVWLTNAKSCYEKSIKINPKYGPSYLGLGVAHVATYFGEFLPEDFDISVNHLIKSLELKIPNPQRAYYFLGLTHLWKSVDFFYKQKNIEVNRHRNKSIHYFRLSAALSSNDWKVFEKLGYLYRQKFSIGQSPLSIDSAILCYEKAASLNPNYRLYESLAEVYDLKGDVKNTISNYEKCLNLNIQTMAFITLLHIYRSEGMYKRAVETYERLLPIKPSANFANIYSILSKMCEQGGDHKRSEKYKQLYQRFKNGILLKNSW